MKAKLASGQPVFGCQIEFASPDIVEALGYLGFDWVFIDAEHGAISEGECANLVRAADAAGITPIVRVPRNEHETILRYMETGVLGVVVPQINSGEEAQQAVDAIKYPPLGHRGIGVSRASEFGLKRSRDAYAEQANQETLFIALVENKRGVANLDEIMAVKGVDVILVGPADLAASMGLPINFDHPEVAAAVDGILTRVIADGRVAAGVNTGPRGARAAEYVHQGVRCCITGVWGLLSAGSRGYLDAAKQAQP